MRSILFSLTLVFFTGCLTEATTADPADDLDEVTAIAVDPDLAPAVGTPVRDERSEAERQMELELVQQDAPWGMAHDRPARPDYTPEELDCRHVVGEPLDPRCKHPL
jgi:hypothetical protein